MSEKKTLEEEVIDELYETEIKKNVRYRYLSGAIRGAGELNFSPKGFVLGFKHKNERFIRSLAEMIDDMYGEEGTISNIDEIQEGSGVTQGVYYAIRLSSTKSQDVLEKCKIVEHGYELVKGIPEGFLRTNNDEKVFLKGLFLSCGSLKVPEMEGEKKGSYKLSFNLNSDWVKEDVANIIAKRANLSRKSVLTKQGGNVLFLKNSEGIGTLLAEMGSMHGALTVYEIITEKQVRNSVNRARNCDMANIDRAVNAGAKQADIVKKIRERKLFDGLTEELKETCILREKYPDAGIAELGKMFKNPVSKSCVNHRLRRLREIAVTAEE